MTTPEDLLQYLHTRWENDAWVTDQEDMARIVREVIASATIQPGDIAANEMPA